MELFPDGKQARRQAPLLKPLVYLKSPQCLMLDAVVVVPAGVKVQVEIQKPLLLALRRRLGNILHTLQASLYVVLLFVPSARSFQNTCSIGLRFFNAYSHLVLHNGSRQRCASSRIYVVFIRLASASRYDVPIFIQTNRKVVRKKFPMYSFSTLLPCASMIAF